MNKDIELLDIITIIQLYYQIEKNDSIKTLIKQNEEIINLLKGANKKNA